MPKTPSKTAKPKPAPPESIKKAEAVTAAMRAAKPPHYVLFIRDTSYGLCGPFSTNGDAKRWANRRKNNPADDPRWQTVQLTTAAITPLLTSPMVPLPA